DPLDLTGVIVTGTLDHRSKLASSVAITSMNTTEINKRGARGTADLLKAIPGTFVDASAGETYTRVYSRGISSSAEDDHGWFYVSLQEDGLPVSATQHTFYSPDLFHRVDLTTRRLEAIRGGSAAITSANAPGGIYNFISREGTPSFEGMVQTTTALQGSENGLYRLDANFSGPAPLAGWTYNIGGFYRYDEGPRNTDFNWGNGGQVKLNLVKKYIGGHLRIYGKYLNDKVNRYQALVATNWEDPEAAFGQDFNTSAVMLPRVSTEIIDGKALRDDADATRTFDTNNGVRAKDVAFGFEIFHEFSDGWALRNQFKFSQKTADWQTSIGSQRIGLESFLPYFLTGSEAPWGLVVFRDAETDEVLARVDNTGALAVFQGNPPSFEYIEGSLPNDGLLGSAPWQKEDEGRDVMFQMNLGKSFKGHQLNGSLFAAHSAVETYTVGSFAFATFENEPRMLRVTLENPGSAVEQLTDAAGVANYGGLFYQSAKADVSQVGLALEDVWKVTDQLTIDLGLRYELVSHAGEKDRAQPSIRPGGIDGDTLTAYDSMVRTPFGGADEFRFDYDYLSYSLGFNYQFNEQIATFARFTRGNKAPELSYYFNTFENIPVDRAGRVQGVYQGELGVKV
ncbi:MAG: TonB-dependent receptor, partial [Bacteroidota bacterium]